MPPPTDSDGIALLADALRSYLAELHTYRTVCRRHQDTAAVEETREGLRVRRQFPGQDRVIACLQASLAGLPGWEGTPFWSVKKKGWEGLQGAQEAEWAKAGLQPLALRGISWEGRAILVSAAAARTDAVLHIELLLPPFPSDLPELPLRKVAAALRCHEYLVPAAVARCLPGLCGPQSDVLTIRAYLQHTTPQNLCASKCIWECGAEP